jgi:hypothetical protein
MAASLIIQDFRRHQSGVTKPVKPQTKCFACAFVGSTDHDPLVVGTVESAGIMDPGWENSPTGRATCIGLLLLSEPFDRAQPLV